MYGSVLAPRKIGREADFHKVLTGYKGCLILG